MNITPFEQSLFWNEKREKEALVASLKNIAKVQDEESANAARTPVKTAKALTKRVGEMRLEFTRKLDDVKKEAIQIERAFLSDLTREIERVTAAITAYEAAKEAERQRIQREAEEARRKEETRLQEQGARRVELLNKLKNILETRDEKRAADAVKFLEEYRFRPGYFHDSVQETNDFLAGVIMEFIPLLKNIKQAEISHIADVVKQEQEHSELSAVFQASAVSAFVTEQAPEKGKNVQMKEVWQVKNPAAYVQLLQFFLQNGGDVSKLEFLVRFAQANKAKAPLGVIVTHETIVRI